MMLLDHLIPDLADEKKSVYCVVPNKWMPVAAVAELADALD